MYPWPKIDENLGGWGGVLPIHKLYGDVPPFREWYRVSNSKIGFKQGIKIMHFDETLPGI